MNPSIVEEHGRSMSNYLAPSGRGSVRVSTEAIEAMQSVLTMIRGKEISVVVAGGIIAHSRLIINHCQFYHARCRRTKNTCPNSAPRVLDDGH